MLSSNQKNLQENLIALAIVIFVFIGLYLIKPSYPFQPKGIALPLVKNFPKVQVESVLTYSTLPYDYQALAVINVEGHTIDPTEQQQNKMRNVAKAIAKKIGASAIVFKSMGYEEPSANNPAPLAKLVLSAIAINP